MTQWTFSTDAVNKMWRLLDYTHEENIEFGSLLCFDKNTHIISAGSMCHGKDDCSISLLNDDDCGSLQAKGSYHTHPGRTEATPALQDVIAHLEDGHLISCIGGGNEINCFLSHDEYKYWEYENKDNIKEALEIEKKLVNMKGYTREEANKYFDFIEQFIPKYFKVHTFKQR